jgi:hypothetical protein
MRTLCVLAAAAALGSVSAQDRKPASPRDTATATIGGNKITIDYGRPYKKGRAIFGGLVPWNEVWRTGANEATTLTTGADLMIGKLHVPKGTYSMFTIPTEKEWTLVVNKAAKQWGAFKYDESQDLGRTPMQVQTGQPEVEQFTISIEPKGAKAGVLKVAWDTTVAQVPITVH